MHTYTCRSLIQIIYIFFFTCASALAAQAQNTSSSGSNTQTNAMTSSGASVNQYYESGGKTTIRSAPDAIAPSLGSGHPCMIGTSVGFSIVGGGVSGGSGKVDVGCMMMRSVHDIDNKAGRIYYAVKDPIACRAWRQVGAIAPNSKCGDERRGTTVSSKSTVTTVALTVRCRKANGVITPVVSRQVANTYTNAQIKAACR